MAYSYSGTSWIGSGSYVFTQTGYGMAWNGFMWVGTGQGGNTLGYSFDGINWNGLGTSTFSVAGYNVTWNGVLWVATGRGATNTLAYSYNGYNWVGLGTGSFSVSGNCVAWNGSMWVAGGMGTNSLAWSNSGITWTNLGTTTFIATNTVSWNGKMWVAGGTSASNNRTIAYSYNGTNWALSNSNAFSSAVYGVGNNNIFGGKLQLSLYGTTKSQTLDLVSDSYYQTGYLGLTMTINSLPLVPSYLSNTAAPFQILGGTSIQNGSYTVVTFLSIGTNTFTVNGSGYINILLVGGGGGGGNVIVTGSSNAGGGGGAGGYILLTNYYILSGTYTLTVGAGGAVNTNGNNTTFGNYTAIGGGFGAYGSTSTLSGQGSGGSGGGGYFYNGSLSGQGTNPPGTGTVLQGNFGGYGYNITNITMSGGGGGAGGAGTNAISTGPVFGNGGSAIAIHSNNLPGYNTVVGICGGGGGGTGFYTTTSNSASTGGSVVYNGITFTSGGSGATYNNGTVVNATNPTSYGGGGGGGTINGTTTIYSGTSGYQGVAIITYAGPNNYVPFKIQGGATLVGNGLYSVVTFSSTGANTFTVNSSGYVNILLVGGGGGGGLSTGSSDGGGAGGGGGGYILLTNYYIGAGTYTINVGAGGAVNTNGGNTIFGNYSAIGGGYGGYGSAGTFNSSGSGGSGGGGYWQSTNTGVGVNSPGQSTSQQGNMGGYGYNITNINLCGGGGGAGGNGINTTNVGPIVGNGGAAIAINSANLPGYNNTIAVCGGGGGGSSWYTTGGTNTIATGGSVIYNGVTYLSGGSGSNYNNGTVTTGTAPQNYGGGGGGAASNNAGTYYGGSPGYQGVCIMTYLAQTTTYLLIPDLVWLKFDNTTYTGGQTLVNAETAGTVSVNFWSANGTITNTRLGGYNCAYITNNNTGSTGKWTVTTSAFTLPANIAGNGWTVAWWMYIPATGSGGGLTASAGAECMLAQFTSNLNTATQGWINTYYSGSYFNGSGNNPSSFVYWYPTSAYNDNASWVTTSLTGVWRHIAFVVTCTSPGTGTFAPYHNGALENGGATLSTSYPATGTSVNFAINANSANIYYRDVRVYGRPLTSNEITSLYNS